MNLPVKALTVLASIKANLLSQQIPKPPEETGSQKENAPAQIEVPKRKEFKSTVRMRHARNRGMGFQKYKQQRGW